MKRGVSGYAAQAQRGVGMLEFLLALLIFCVGMMGLMSAQLAGKRAGFEASHRSTATALAAARITPDQLAEVEKHLTAMNATDDPEEILAHDLAFHREIAAAAGNDTMAAILEGLSSRTFRARVWRGYQEEGAFERTRREHAAIHRALVARDPEAARAAAAAHVGEVEEWLRAQLG